MNEMDNGGKEALRTITETLSKAMRVVIMWDALHYTGHFIDAHPEMRERIDAVHKLTTEALHAFGLDSEAEAQSKKQK